MKAKIIIISIISLFIISCNNNHTHEPATETHEHSKIQFTTYNSDFELFAEADNFLIGHTANILAHFSTLPDFNALESGSITVRLVVNGKETKQTLEEPSRKGIYSFNIKPETSGNGKLIFDIKNKKGVFQVLVPEIIVYSTSKEVHDVAHNEDVSNTNTVSFTKEQSWKVNFSTEKPRTEPFGKVIKTIAQIQSAINDETFITANTNGIIQLYDNSILEGKDIAKGQYLFSISGTKLADNNSSVRFLEAQNNYKKAKADYKRMKELAKDKIISEKELLNAKNEFENSKIIFNNLNDNFSASGQKINSTTNGFVKQIFVKNGQYVEAGQNLLLISQNKNLLLRADIQQKNVADLASIKSAVIRQLQSNKSYTLDELNGKILSYGRSTNSDNYLIPISLQIDNNKSFIPGGFVELYLQTQSNMQALTLPNSSFLEQQGNFFVYVQINPELFEKRQVIIGATDGIKTEIISGIKASERVVSKGAIFVKLAQGAAALDPHSGHVH